MEQKLLFSQQMALLSLQLSPAYFYFGGKGK
jgi:hypothetical protein